MSNWCAPGVGVLFDPEVGGEHRGEPVPFGVRRVGARGGDAASFLDRALHRAAMFAGHDVASSLVAVGPVVVALERRYRGEFPVLDLRPVRAPGLDERCASLSFFRSIAREGLDDLRWCGQGLAVLEGPARAVLLALERELGVNDMGVIIPLVVVVLRGVDGRVPGDPVAAEVAGAPLLRASFACIVVELVRELHDDAALDDRLPWLVGFDTGLSLGLRYPGGDLLQQFAVGLEVRGPECQRGLRFFF